VDTHKLRQSDRQFGLTLGAILIVLSVIGWGLRRTVPLPLVGAAIILIGVALVRPGLLWPLNLVWSRAVAPTIARLNNMLLLGVIFYLLITPVAIIMRLVRRDSMDRARQPTLPTYARPPRRGVSAEGFHDQF
jgi:MFS superfamily sulfate permease-like transporter